MAGAEGFEPPRWLDQNQLPYHLATPHRFYYHKISIYNVKRGKWIQAVSQTTNLYHT